MNGIIKDLIWEVRDNGELEKLADAMSVEVDAIPMDCLEDELSQMEPYDAFTLGFNHGDFSWSDSYYAYDGYANIYSLSDSQYEEMLFNEVLENIGDIDELENYREIETIGEYFTKIEDIKSQIDEESYSDMRKEVMEIINDSDKSWQERANQVGEIKQDWWNNASDLEKIGAYWHELFNCEFMYNWDIEFDIKQCLPIEKELFSKAYSLARKYVDLTMEV